MAILILSGPVLDSRISFEAAALLVSLTAFVFLAIIAVNLHLRLARVENRLAESPGQKSAYEHLRGRPLALDTTGADFVLLLSSNCETCERVLDHLCANGRDELTIVTWIDGSAATRPALPAHLRFSGVGPVLSRELGIGVTPFLLELDSLGRVLKAGPILSLDSLPASKPADRAQSSGARSAKAGQEA